jgi:C6 transcription factor Pro1
MDGGAGQKHMSETIKERIKQNGLVRRERRLLTYEDEIIIIDTDTNRVSPTDATSISASRASSADTLAVEYVPPAASAASTLSTSSVRPGIFRTSIDQSEKSQFPHETTSSSTSSPGILPAGLLLGSSGPTGLATPIPAQLGSVMIYLDYVFPFLFPFYQPSLIETGRQWLLGLLCQNEVSFHIAASLSAYFFSLVAQSDEQDTHDDCKALVRNRLVEQMDMALTSIQSTISSINHHGVQFPLLDKTRVLEEIAQLLIVEVTVRRTMNWKVHLTPALALFDEIFKSHGTDHLGPSVAVLLSALPTWFPMAVPHHKPLPNTADQSALAFFVSLLLFVDIVASTSLITPPALQNYHHRLLSSNGEEKCRVQLETVVGCQNWALVAIGNISALCAWKRDAKQSGTFSVVELVSLAGPISQALEEGLVSLNDVGPARSQSKMGASSLEGYYRRHDRAIDHTSIANVTRVWGYAAKIYLSVTLSGWQANSADTQACIAKILSLLQTIESPAQLRSLSWPICVAGCLALPSQEHDFRRIFGFMGPLGEFGTVYNTLNIMEGVWRSRNTLDGNIWDIASSLGILGSPALLL